LQWIRANDLEHWAGTIDSRTSLSEIVASLVRASAEDIGSFRFPTGDSSQAPGYDGRLTAKGVPPFVPDGESVWEFGTDGDYLDKAERGLQQRTREPRGVNPAETTFVFVTPRHWKRLNPTLEEWQKGKTAIGPWKEVKAIDGVALEHWLLENSAAAARIAREILHLAPQTGASSLDEFWDEYSSRFKPVLSEQVLVCGREEQAKRLLQQLREQPQLSLWQADSSDEVMAFVAAAIRTADPELRKFCEARTLVLESEDAARFFSRRSRLILVTRGRASSLAGMLCRYNPTIVPRCRDDSRAENAIVLKRPTSHDLSEALKLMGFPPEKAYQLARTSGRSATVLARLIPSASAPRPAWHGQPYLLPALLAGGWDASSEEDRRIVKELSGQPSYEEYEDGLRKYIHIPDAPLEHEGQIWKVRAPVDAISHLGQLIGNTHLVRLESAFKEVFSADDPRLDLPSEELPYAGLTGKKHRHSEWIREGLANTLLLFSVFGEGIQLDIREGIQPYVNRLISELPGLNTNWRLIASIERQLPLLMEAAPRPLVQALGHLLEGNGNLLRPIFRDVDALFTSSPHTGLLWALEVLAWDPEWLLQASLLLSRLSRIDPGGKLANRPIHTLQEIFLAWHPNTNASLEQRMPVLDHILHDEPEIGWRLILALLPANFGVAQNTATPRFREAGASEKEILTRGIVAKCYEAVIERALTLAQDNPERLATLIREVPLFPPKFRKATYQLLDKTARERGSEAKTILWSAVRDLANRHGAFPGAAWSMKGPELDELQSLAVRLEPTDPFARLSWLFDDHHPAILCADSAKVFDAIEEAREAAVREIYASGREQAIISLAMQVKLPRFVALAVPKNVEDPEVLDHLIDLSSGESKLDEFAVLLSAEGERLFGQKWEERILARARENRSTPQTIAKLLLAWRDEPKTWRFAESLGSGVDRIYWEKKQSWPVHGDAAVLEQVARKYLAVGRATAAIQALHLEVKHIDPGIVFEILDRAVDEFNRSPGVLSSMVYDELAGLFDVLSEREDVPTLDLAKREYAYLPLFRFRRKNLNLHKLMAADPVFFVSLIHDSFKPSKGDMPAPTEEQNRRAQAGYQLLSEMNEVPGVSGSEIDASVLTTWAREVRRLAHEQDRGIIAEQRIGHVLAHAPADADGAWPHRVVRDLVEELKSDQVEHGIAIERFNMRGGFSKSMYEGGGQERSLAAQADSWAKLASKWPRTHAMLMGISRSWDEQAKREDERARQDELKFEQ
jgi:hypothetical protein